MEPKRRILSGGCRGGKSTKGLTSEQMDFIMNAPDWAIEEAARINAEYSPKVTEDDVFIYHPLTFGPKTSS